MDNEPSLHQILNRLTIRDVVVIVLAVALARLLTASIKWGFSTLGSRGPASWRIRILSWMPIARLTVVLAAIAFVVSIVIVPSWENVVGLLLGAGLVLAFALKDYGSCLLAGLVTIFERVYQPGDWIEIKGA